jgi:Tfp pilus assembly protein PilF
MLLLLFTACSSEAKKDKRPKLDRDLIDAEMEFGKDAARFDLWREAIFRWEQVVEKQPDNPAAVNNLAVAYESIGDYEKAREFYQNAVELDEDSASIRRNLRRFESFYKRHQRQLEREKRSRELQKQRQEQAEAEEADEGGNS